MSDDRVEGPVTADMLYPPGKEIEVGDCRVRLDYDLNTDPPPWEGFAALVPVLLFEGNGRMECHQIGTACDDDWIGGGGLSLVPLDVVAKQREALLDMVCDDRGELEELAEYDHDYRQVYSGDAYDEREMLREFLWKKLEEKRPDPKYGRYESPHSAMRDYFGRLEGMLQLVGIPAEAFQVPAGQELGSCLMALTPKWREEAFGDPAAPLPDDQLEKEVDEFAELYRRYRNGEVYAVDVWAGTSDLPINSCGGFYDLDEAAAFASETIRGYEADAEVEAEP